jgi:hypothetical protein
MYEYQLPGSETQHRPQQRKKEVFWKYKDRPMETLGEVITCRTWREGWRDGDGDREKSLQTT